MAASFSVPGFALTAVASVGGMFFPSAYLFLHRETPMAMFASCCAEEDVQWPDHHIWCHNYVIHTCGWNVDKKFVKFEIDSCAFLLA